MIDRKEKIMQASIQLFVQRGFHNTSTRMIAEQAGVSEGLIFRHFRSKDALLDSLLQQGADEMYQAVAEIISEHPMDDAQKIASIARDSKISAVFIDVGRQSNPKLLDLAHKMDAEYINLPRANAKDLSQSLKTSLEQA